MAHGWHSSTRRERLPADWQQRRRTVLARDGYVCQLQLVGCTRDATEVDHATPGDNHSLGNLRASCHSCNAAANLATRPRPPAMRRQAERHPGTRRRP